GGVVQLGLVDRPAPLSAEILLGEEGRGTEPLRMVRVGRREEPADQGERTVLAAPDAGAGGVAAEEEAPAAGAEIARVGVLLADLPAAEEPDAVRVEQAPVPLAVRSPAEIGLRIDGPRGRLAEEEGAAEGEESAQDAPQRHLVA